MNKTTVQEDREIQLSLVDALIRLHVSQARKVRLGDEERNKLKYSIGAVLKLDKFYSQRR